MAATECLFADVLRQFAIGELPKADMRRVAEHVEAMFNTTRRWPGSTKGMIL